MKLSTFLIFTTLGAGLWNSILAAIGYYLHSVVPEDMLMEKVALYSRELSYVFVVLAVGVVIFLVYRGFVKKRDVVKTE